MGELLSLPPAAKIVGELLSGGTFELLSAYRREDQPSNMHEFISPIV